MMLRIYSHRIKRQKQCNPFVCLVAGKTGVCFWGRRDEEEDGGKMLKRKSLLLFGIQSNSRNTIKSTRAE